MLLHRARTAVLLHISVCQAVGHVDWQYKKKFPEDEALLSLETSETSRPTTAIQRHNPRDLILPQLVPSA